MSTNRSDRLGAFADLDAVDALTAVEIRAAFDVIILDPRANEAVGHLAARFVV